MGHEGRLPIKSRRLPGQSLDSLSLFTRRRKWRRRRHHRPDTPASLFPIEPFINANGEVRARTYI